MPFEHRHHARCACGSSLSSYERGAAPRPFALAGTERVYERARPFLIRHIHLVMDLLIEDKSLTATATLDVERVDPEAAHVTLDAVGLDLSSIEVNAGDRWASAKYVYDGEVLRVDAPRGAKTFSIRARYAATPRRGMYFLAPDDHVKDRPRQVWTQCQDEDARFIFPCHDKPNVKQTTEVEVRVPKGWYALSNGALVREAEEGDKKLFHWKMSEPHPSYLFTLVAGEFAQIEAEADGVPLTYLVPKGREADGRRTFARTPDMITNFGKRFGVKYPWNKYAQIVVSDFIFGGMENTTATTMYEHILLDERAAIDLSADDLIAHELAHQWFGDYVTCRDWSEAWLNEGFATYCEHLDREHFRGEDEYVYGVKLDMDAYFAEARTRYKRPIVCQDYEEPIDIFDRHLYEKGGCVLHMLRRALGELFFEGIGLYLRRHQKSVVETRDLMRALEDVSGRGLERFFEQWVFRAGHPELNVKIEHDGAACTVTVKQTQQVSHGAQHGASGGQSEPTVPLFAFDLAIDLYFDGRVVREVRHVDKATQTFVIPAEERPRFVVIDPELAVLAEVHTEAPGDMLRAQLKDAKTPRARMLAAEPLGRLDDPPTAAALEAALLNEDEFWGARAEIAAALGTLRSDAALAALEKGAASKHPKVRRAVMSALGCFRTAKAADLLKKKALSDESYLVEAEAARALGATRQPSAFDTLVEVLDRSSWADVIRGGALDGLANLRDERGLAHVLARTRYGGSLRSRRAAILALPKIAPDKKARETLEELLDESDPYLRVDVVRAIGEVGDPKARGALQKQFDRDLDGRVRRRIREVLRDLGSAGKRETDRLRDELEAMRNEHADIKARLGKLEALLPKSGDKEHRGGDKGRKGRGGRR